MKKSNFSTEEGEFVGVMFGTPGDKNAQQIIFFAEQLSKERGRANLLNQFTLRQIGVSFPRTQSVQLFMRIFRLFAHF